MANRWCFPCVRYGAWRRWRPVGVASAGAVGAGRGAQSTGYIVGTRRASPWCANARVVSGVPASRRSGCRLCRRAAAACRTLAEGRWEGWCWFGKARASRFWRMLPGKARQSDDGGINRWSSPLPLLATLESLLELLDAPIVVVSASADMLNCGGGDCATSRAGGRP